MEDYFKKQAEVETVLRFRHPWFNLFYNWLIAVLVLALFGSFVWWGLQISAERKAEQMTATALAAWHEEQQAEDEAIRSSQEYIMDQEAKAVAKAFYGIRLFTEKYHYSEADLETYARCMFNRAENEDLTKVISITGQFTGYTDDNPVLAEYYDLALRLVKEWHEESVKPVDASYQFAELTANGIYLKNDLHADGYARRWHA